MDNSPIAEEREQPPAWARPETKGLFIGPATQKQLDFIRDLSTRKDLGKLEPEQRAALQQPEEFWHEESTRLTKEKASRMIELLLKQNDKPKDAQQPTMHMAERLAVGVPAGRYAVFSDEGELRFYKVWVSRDKKRLNMYVEHGPDQSDLRYQKTILTILNKIKTAGIRQCAIRYGMEIGHCSNCGLRLTNRISRELGIGPVCGGRMFGDDFKIEVKAKKKELSERGIDWREEVQ